jgi:hypothetical protein
LNNPVKDYYYNGNYYTYDRGWRVTWIVLLSVFGGISLFLLIGSLIWCCVKAKRTRILRNNLNNPYIPRNYNIAHVNYPYPPIQQSPYLSQSTAGIMMNPPVVQVTPPPLPPPQVTDSLVYPQLPSRLYQQPIGSTVMI